MTDKMQQLRNVIESKILENSSSDENTNQSAAKKKESITSALKKAVAIGEKTPVTILQEILQKIGQVPVYEIVQNDTNPITFTCTVMCLNKRGYGTSRSKKDAKHEAAKSIIEQLYEKTIEETTVKDFNDYCNIDDNEVIKLQFMCKKHNLNNPQYFGGIKTDSPYGVIYNYQCVVADFDTKGEGQTSNLAKQNSAKKMIETLNDFFTPSKSKYIKGDTCDSANILEGRSSLSKKTSTKIDDIITFSNEFVVDSNRQTNRKLSILLQYISELAHNCSSSINSREINIPKKELIILRKELQQFLKSANIHFYHMVIENAEPEKYLFIIQLNSGFDVCEMSIGKTRDEAELRSINKIIAALRKKFND